MITWTLSYCHKESNKKDQMLLHLKTLPHCGRKAWLQTAHKLLCVCPEGHMRATGFLKESHFHRKHMHCNLRIPLSIILDRDKNDNRSSKDQVRRQNQPVFLIKNI